MNQALHVTPAELEDRWSFADLMEMNDVLDAWEEAGSHG